MSIHVPVEVIAEAIHLGYFRMECHVGMHVFGPETIFAIWKQENFRQPAPVVLAGLAAHIYQENRRKLEQRAATTPQPETVWEKVAALLKSEAVELEEFEMGVRVVRSRLFGPDAVDRLRLFEHDLERHDPNDPRCPANHADTFNHPVECLCLTDNHRVDIGAPVG